MKQIFSSPKYKRITTIVGITVLLLVVFQAGMFVGFHKAKMGIHGDERFERAYGEHFKNGPFGFPQDDFPEAHGASGRVLSVNLPTIIVEGRDSEKTVLVGADTVIRKDRSKVQAGLIAPNDFVIVIGSPNEKQEIEAKLIRMLPPPPDFSSSTIAP